MGRAQSSHNRRTIVTQSSHRMRARADLLKEPMDLCEDSNAYTILRCSRDLTQRCARCRYHKIFIRKRPRRARRTVYIARAREGQTGMHDVGTRSIHVHVPLEDRALSIIPARARSRSRAPAPIPDIVPRTWEQLTIVALYILYDMFVHTEYRLNTVRPYTRLTSPEVLDARASRAEVTSVVACTVWTIAQSANH